MTAYLNDIVGVVTAIAALTAAVISLINKGKIHQVHVSINSRMDQLLQERGIAARAEGVIEGQQKQVITTTTTGPPHADQTG